MAGPLMAWLDDRIWCHPKIVEISDKSVRSYVFGLAYASGMQTGGKLSVSQQKLLGATPRVRRELVTAGLWDLNGDGNAVCIHDWDAHNGLRDDRRAKDRDRKRAWRKSQRQ